MGQGTYKIGEAASLLNLKTYVLRFWETEFSQIAPLRTEKGQRLYTEEDISLLKRIRFLLHDRGLTIEGAKRVLQEEYSKGHNSTEAKLLEIVDEHDNIDINSLPLVDMENLFKENISDHADVTHRKYFHNSDKAISFNEPPFQSNELTSSLASDSSHSMELTLPMQSQMSKQNLYQSIIKDLEDIARILRSR